MRILISEEYGYADWIWDYPGTVDELVADWKAERTPLSYKHCGVDPDKEFKGTLTPLPEDLIHNMVQQGRTIEDDFDGSAHFHIPDDSGIELFSPELFLKPAPEVVQAWEDEQQYPEGA